MRRYKLRAAFMMLGSLLGVAALVVVGSIADGAQRKMRETMRQIFGQSSIIVTAGGGALMGGPRPESSRLKLDDMPALTRSIELPLGTNHRGAPPAAFLGGHGTSEYYMVNDFVRCILDDTKPAIDVYEGLDQTLPGVCAHMSAENGSEPVEVPDLRPEAR
jgi:hypothetical protein